MRSSPVSATRGSMLRRRRILTRNRPNSTPSTSVPRKAIGDHRSAEPGIRAVRHACDGTWRRTPQNSFAPEETVPPSFEKGGATKQTNQPTDRMGMPLIRDGSAFTPDTFAPHTCRCVCRSASAQASFFADLVCAVIWPARLAKQVDRSSRFTIVSIPSKASEPQSCHSRGSASSRSAVPSN